MISIIRKDNSICELTAENISQYFLNILENNNVLPENFIQNLYTSLPIQSTYCPNSFGIGLYGAKNIKSTLSTTTLILIKRFYISILLILKSYLEMLEKIIYTIIESIRLPIYPQIIFKNIFKQQYTSAH